ncbi:methyltransferase domain-containing protein [Amycolatopsis sp. GM8]|uniref:methyltransferase domain-containing protein n=1 Tax=Amycolatopsis sp. GM8 TaxID=2896530 RepID=UPI001F384E2C|nr:methyltransferase domain-containing protein [Amycolatopsis sp. GM8]
MNTTTTQPGWAHHARDLAALLRDRGDLVSPEWVDAFAAVPRHVFVPTVFEQDAGGVWREWAAADDWERVYSTRTLVTALGDGGGYPEPVSSSTNPELMARMLETLDVRDGHRVLEIGTGTGYNAALMSHRLGDRNVYSVDVDDRLVELARDRLAEAGYTPTVVAVDGEDGLSEHGPYDRIIATCAVPSVPRAWADQLAPGGEVLVDLKLATSAGNLVHLHRTADGGLEGRFLPRMATFMLMRHLHATAAPQAAAAVVGARRERTTIAPAMPWQTEPVVWFLAQLHGLPEGVRHGAILDPGTRQPVAATLSAPDGSRARIDLANNTVTETGGTALWEPVEAAYARWVDAGRPGWDRLGVTVASDGVNRVWLDDPAIGHAWPWSRSGRH